MRTEPDLETARSKARHRGDEWMQRHGPLLEAALGEIPQPVRWAQVRSAPAFAQREALMRQLY